MPRRRSRVLVAVAAVTATIGLWAGSASAHVTVQPPAATQGASDVALAFRVPNEEDSADTVQLDVQFPSNPPIASVAVQPLPGWTYNVTTTQLAEPIQTDDGTVTEVVSEIVWSGGTIKPGEYQDFTVVAGALPDTATSLEFKAVQTYSNGDVVRWIDQTPPGGPEPQHPTPTLTLTKADNTGSAAASTSSSDTTARLLGIIGIVVGVIGVAVAVVAVTMSRRKPSPPTAGPPDDALAAP